VENGAGGNPAVGAAPHCQKSERRSRVRAISSGSAAPPARDLHVHALSTAARRSSAIGRTKAVRQQPLDPNFLLKLDLRS
jgi:hypothetical protein